MCQPGEAAHPASTALAAPGGRRSPLQAVAACPHQRSPLGCGSASAARNVACAFAASNVACAFAASKRRQAALAAEQERLVTAIGEGYPSEADLDIEIEIDEIEIDPIRADL